MLAFELFAVRTGGPQEIGRRRGRPVISSFNRRLVTEPTIRLTEAGLEGDQPTDTRPNGKGGQIHGGLDKAVYAYPRSNYTRWRRELSGQVLDSRTFGENLVLLGLTEHDVRIGDVWAWGDAQLVVTKPRMPCATLDFIFGHPKPNMIRRMRANGYCGWYLSVSRPAVVPTRTFIRVVKSDPDAPTVAAAFAAKVRRQAATDDDLS